MSSNVLYSPEPRIHPGPLAALNQLDLAALNLESCFSVDISPPERPNHVFSITNDFGVAAPAFPDVWLDAAQWGYSGVARAHARRLYQDCLLTEQSPGALEPVSFYPTSSTLSAAANGPEAHPFGYFPTAQAQAVQLLAQQPGKWFVLPLKAEFALPHLIYLRSNKDHSARRLLGWVSLKD